MNCERAIRSANLHLDGRCNYRCEHCFDTCLPKACMEPAEWMPRLIFLKEQGVTKINISGGEPMLYPHLEEMCRLLKSVGFTVSIVSNGSLITEDRLKTLSRYVDWMGLSVDSPEESDEIKIGRHMEGVNHLEHVI